MTAPSEWQEVAYNQATESENRIHSDEVARRHGFRGGLVPGVTVYAYLVHPAVVSWGLDWLGRGSARVTFRKPLYDRLPFRVSTAADGEEAYLGKVIDTEGTLCAEGRVALPEDVAEPPVRRGDPPAPDRRPDATRATMEDLRVRGMGALVVPWQARGSYDRYTRSLDPMPDPIRPDRGGYANPAFTLGLANLGLAGNVRLGPWIHVESGVRHHAPVPRDSRLVVESRIQDLFARGGHEFVDLDVSVFLEPDVPALTASHRAIYRLREG